MSLTLLVIDSTALSHRPTREGVHGLLHVIRDWSLITGRGGLQNGKIAGPKLFAPPPPQDRVKLFAPPPL